MAIVTHLKNQIVTWVRDDNDKRISWKLNIL